MTETLDWLVCTICRQPIDTSGPAVCQYEGRDGTNTWGWVAFVDDWRGGPVDLMHGACFASEHGAQALVDVVHARDVINARESS
jgi:hypothetical protein